MGERDAATPLTEEVSLQGKSTSTVQVVVTCAQHSTMKGDAVPAGFQVADSSMHQTEGNLHQIFINVPAALLPA
jgi:hypothetical protein